MTKSLRTAQLCLQYLVDNFASLLKTVLSEVNMHRIVGGDPLLLQRRVQIMDAYARLQHDHPALPPSLHVFQVMSLDLVADRMASKM